MIPPTKEIGDPEQAVECPICGGAAALLGVVDFNKSCGEARGLHLPSAGIPIAYFECQACGFCYAPAIYKWTREEFALRIYNDEYVRVDPDYVEVRPRAHADYLIELFGDRARAISHLDYGGGNGLMSDMLRDSGWQSTSYDPFVDGEISLAELGQFDLITAYEVFEHVPDVRGLARNLSSLLKPDGVVHFSTMLIDGKMPRKEPITWWYASPRNGHISLFSRDALFYLGNNEGLNFTSFTPNLHAFWRSVPPWASHIIR